MWSNGTQTSPMTYVYKILHATLTNSLYRTTRLLGIVLHPAQQQRGCLVWLAVQYYWVGNWKVSLFYVHWNSLILNMNDVGDQWPSDFTSHWLTVVIEFDRYVIEIIVVPFLLFLFFLLVLVAIVPFVQWGCHVLVPFLAFTFNSLLWVTLNIEKCFSHLAIIDPPAYASLLCIERLPQSLNLSHIAYSA